MVYKYYDSLKEGDEQADSNFDVMCGLKNYKLQGEDIEHTSKALLYNNYIHNNKQHTFHFNCMHIQQFYLWHSNTNVD